MEHHRRARRRKRALFIAGSLHQTTQLHAVARELRGFDVAFSAYYGTRLEETMRRFGLNEATICGNRLRRATIEYLVDHQLPIDDGGREQPYDLTVTCSDLVLPENIRRSRVVVVQEGVFDREGIAYALCRRFPQLPRWLAGTAMTGLSGGFDTICVASHGYREHLLWRGVEPSRIAVTGIPRFDDCASFETNDFPHRGFVLVCTSGTRRETLKVDSRHTFLRKCKRIAGGRKTIFKLHPSEDVDRSTRAIREHFPDAIVYARGNAEHMIANCDVLVTEWSSTAFVGIALGKEVHSSFDLDELRRLCPIQNGGRSAANIARVCERRWKIERISAPTPFVRPSKEALTSFARSAAPRPAPAG